LTATFSCLPLAADDEDIAAKAIVAAGGYEKFFLSHIACPGREVFERIKPMQIPNFSIRMSSLTAAVIRPQIKDLPARIVHANACYDEIRYHLLKGCKKVDSVDVLDCLNSH
jgi:hypothetical protein